VLRMTGVSCDGLEGTQMPAFVTFVPGIMGTELWTAPSRAGRCVWPENLSQLAYTLWFESWSLEGHQVLFPGKVFSGSRFGYERLFRALERGGFKEPDNLLPFGYDWRQSTSASAKHLVTALKDQAGLQDLQVVLIGHSMGCLVIRSALRELVKEGVRVDKVIEIAPPHRGSSKGFRQLHQFPNVHPIIDLVRGWFLNFPWIDPAYQPLMRTLNGLWDLLPPDEDEILSPFGGGAPSRSVELAGMERRN
jgi:pimeloyl-ACP methyl ester carboxylesterase